MSNSFPYFISQATAANTKKTAANHIIRYMPHRARHLFDFHVSPETYSSLNNMKGGLAKHYLASQPELSASLSFQVTMWCSGSGAVISDESPADVYSGITGLGTNDGYFDLQDLATDQSLTLPAQLDSVELGPHPPFVTVTLFANFNSNIQNDNFTSSSLSPALMHVSSAYLPPYPDYTVTNQGPVAIMRTILSQTQADEMFSAGDTNNLFDILTRRNGKVDEDALLYFNLRLRGNAPGGTPDNDLTSAFIDSTNTDAGGLDIVCFNKNGRVSLGSIYADSYNWENDASLIHQKVSTYGDEYFYQPKIANNGSGFMHYEQMVDYSLSTGNNLTTPDASLRSSSLDTNQRSHLGVGLSHDQLNKLSINLVSHRSMHRYGFLYSKIINDDMSEYGYSNDFRTLAKNLTFRTGNGDGTSTYYDNSIASFYENSLINPLVVYEYNPSSFMPSALLGIAFNTGLDQYGTIDRQTSSPAIGIISNADSSFNAATGDTNDNEAALYQVNQRFSGSFDLNCQEFFTCVIKNPFSSSYANSDGYSSDRLFDDRYNVSLLEGSMSKMRFETGPEVIESQGFIWVDSGKAEIKTERETLTTHQINGDGIFNIRLGMDSAGYPYQFLNTREIPKPLHMDHMGRNDPDSGFDVGD